MKTYPRASPPPGRCPPGHPSAASRDTTPRRAAAGTRARPPPAPPRRGFPGRLRSIFLCETSRLRLRNDFGVFAPDRAPNIEKDEPRGVARGILLLQGPVDRGNGLPAEPVERVSLRGQIEPERHPGPALRPAGKRTDGDRHRPIPPDRPDERLRRACGIQLRELRRRQVAFRPVPRAQFPDV